MAVRPFPKDAQALKDDAIATGLRPGALAVHLRAGIVLVTSWPWFEGEGDNRVALIMARTDPNDPSTNKTTRYFMLMKKVGEMDL